ALAHGSADDSVAAWDHGRSLGEVGPDVTGEGQRHEVLRLELHAVEDRTIGIEERPDALHDPLVDFRSVQRPRKQLPQLGQALGRMPPPLGLLEQARVVDCDGGLVAEGLEKDNFPRREYTLGLIADGEHAEHRLRDPKRHGENRANAGGLLPTPKVLGRKRPRPEGVADHRSSFDDGLARDPDARWKEMARLEGITGTPGASDREQRAIGLQKTEDRGWDSQKEQDR